MLLGLQRDRRLRSLALEVISQTGRAVPSCRATPWWYSYGMRPLRYAINVTLDGCVDHRAGSKDEELHRFWAEKLAQADALLFGRVTYEMMQAAWRWPANGLRPEWMAEWMEPFARTIDAAKKYVVSGTLSQFD